MIRLANIARVSTNDGEPTTVGDVTVTPHSWTLVVRFPFGGIVWNRPIGVTVRRGDRVEEIPIRDVTRIAELSLAAAIGVLFLVSRIGSRNQKETR
jgi:hypothetical protein